jgi:hypothetical protein
MAETCHIAFHNWAEYLVIGPYDLPIFNNAAPPNAKPSTTCIFICSFSPIFSCNDSAMLLCP